MMFYGKDPEPYVPIDDVADYLSVSIETIRDWIHQRKITPNAYLKLGQTYRFQVSKVLQDLEGYDERKRRSEQSANSN